MLLKIYEVAWYRKYGRQKMPNFRFFAKLLQTLKNDFKTTFSGNFENHAAEIL
jgi:hypothetical protein